MFKKILFITLSLSIVSCEQIEEKDFNTVASEFVNDYAKLFPDETPLSINNSELPNLHIPDAPTMDSVKIFYDHFSEAMSHFDSTQMTISVRSGYFKIKNILKNINTYLIDYPTSPAVFNVRYGFQRILNSSFDTPEHRLQILFEKLDKVPAFYQAAKSQLKNANFHQTNKTVDDHLQTYQFFDKTLPDFIAAKHHITPQYQARLEAAKLAIKDYVAYVESLRLI